MFSGEPLIRARPRLRQDDTTRPYAAVHCEQKHDFEADVKDFVVFYAWQSDRPERFNRYLIRFALNLAAKNISADHAVGIRVRIDADTEGVHGHCPVTETILKKIAVCDVFVPDLTFVASTDAGKLIPNPNVMLEYGYALDARSFSVMIPVMNTAYGAAEELPFDMGHLRFPVRYDLPATAKNAERRVARKALTEELETILRGMIAEGVGAADRTPFRATAATTSPAFFFPRLATIASFGNPGEQEYKFEGDKAVYLRLFPRTSEGQPKIGRAVIKDIIHHKGSIRPMSDGISGIASSNNFGWACIDPSGNSTTKNICQAFPSGELWGISSQVFIETPVTHFVRADEPRTIFGAITVEKLCTRTLENFIKVASTVMQLRPPFIVEIGIVGTKGVFMRAPHPESPNGSNYGPIRDDSLVRRYDLAKTDRATQQEILRDFFDELYDLAEISRSEILTDAHVQANDIPRRT